MHSHDHTSTDLTKNQTLVFDALETANGPLSAYTILDKLRDDGFRAPLQVYRALDKLVEFGMVHRLESLNAFVACRQPDCESHQTIAFTICDSCGQVDEINNAKLARQLKSIADQTAFALARSTVELRGNCHDCAKTA